jgi:hypothetical protein
MANLGPESSKVGALAEADSLRNPIEEEEEEYTDETYSDEKPPSPEITISSSQSPEIASQLSPSVDSSQHPSISSPLLPPLFTRDPNSLSSSESPSVLPQPPKDNRPPSNLPPQDGLPPTLRPIVFHARDSLTYRALEGEQLHGLNQTMLTSVVNELRRYSSTAVENDLIDEACYIERCIENVRGDKSGEKMGLDRELKSLDERIREAYLELSEREQYWATQQAIIDRELEMALEDLQIENDQALSDFDNLWKSAKKKQVYSKPSVGLLDLRHKVKKLIRVKQFEEVRMVAAVVETKQKEEVDEATKRMNSGYLRADQQLNEKFELQRTVLIEAHHMKIHNLIRARERNLLPINQRIKNLEKLKQEIIMTAKVCEQQMVAAASMVLKKPANGQLLITSQLPTIIGMPKLALPAVTRMKKKCVRPTTPQKA